MLWLIIFLVLAELLYDIPIGADKVRQYYQYDSEFRIDKGKKNKDGGK